MPNITTCTGCGCLHEACSEEAAHEPERLCFGCQRGAEAERAGLTLDHSASTPNKGRAAATDDQRDAGRGRFPPS